MSEIYKRLNPDGSIDVYTRTKTGGELFRFDGGCNHYPAPEQLNSEGFVLFVEPPMDSTTQCHGDHVFSADSCTCLVADLPPEEIAANQADQLQVAKDIKLAEIETSFAAATAEPIIYDGVTYPGGYDKADMRENGRKVVLRAIEKGWIPVESTVEFYDINDNEIVLTTEQANDVVLLTALKFKSDISIYKSKLVAINAANSLEEIADIFW